MHDHTGNNIRGYELREQLGTGGFGAVYRAFQPSVNREVAIKIILPGYANQPDFIRRFEAEAQVVARLEHPHIVPLYDYWREPDSAYLVMRLLRGSSLRARLQNHQQFSLDEIARLLDQIAAALTVAHRQGVIHRDLKPDNILLDEYSNGYLADFGIAKSLGIDTNATAEGRIVGSPAYMAPEQIKGGSISAQSDLYSLGIVLYELLTGVKPFPDDLTLTALLYKHLNESLPSLSDKRPDLPETLNVLLQTATAKDPAQRYRDAASIATDFRRAVTAMPITGQANVETVFSRAPIETLPAAKPIGVTPSIEHTVLDIATEQIENPYKGLRAFQEADAAEFFGREALIKQILQRLSEPDAVTNFLAVVGPSGSGKSSVVRAGIVPALRHGALPNSQRWFIVEMIPSSHPMEELEAALLRIAVNPPSSLRDQLREDERGLLRAIKRVLPGDENSELVLIIDQFEELFTLVEDEADRSHFLNSLLVAVTESRSRLRVIITLRADFYDRPLMYQHFGELIRKRTEVVLPLSDHELKQVIVSPAEHVGLLLEPDLVTKMIKDVGDQPGALPLLEYALTELFEQRDGRKLTLEAYQASGGVVGALAHRADDLYLALNETEKELVHQFFLRLVTLGEGTEDVRRRVRRTELVALGGSEQSLDLVIQVYAKYRLLTSDRDPITRGPTLEVAHEALIRTWTRLRGWLDDSRDDLRFQRRLAQAEAEWDQGGRDPSFLLTGSRLEQFDSWAGLTTLGLNAGERTYLDASIAEAAEGKRRDEDRKTHEAETARRADRFAERARQFRSAAAVLAIIGLLAAVALVAAIGTLNEARIEGTQAAYFSIELGHAATLAAGGVIVPVGTQTPAVFLPTLTQVAMLNAWNPDDPKNLHVDDNGVQMVRVPPGCFLMGDLFSADEQPISQVCFQQEFWIDRFEVTNGQFYRLKGKAAVPSQWNDDNRPRETITWVEARDFCQKRGARLPTEAEWEYATRGPDSRIYAWGDTYPTQDESAHYVADYANSPKITQLTGENLRRLGRSWVGAYDLTGNVLEWVSSLYRPYPYNAEDGREDLTNGTDRRVVRGGVQGVRAGGRDRALPDSSSFFRGFRCAHA